MYGAWSILGRLFDVADLFCNGGDGVFLGVLRVLGLEMGVFPKSLEGVDFGVS